MSKASIHTDILGSGMAGKAIAKGLAFLKITDSELNIGDVQFLPRGKPLVRPTGAEQTVLCIANPSGLHTGLILEGIETGYGLIVCEKPTSTDKGQLKLLEQACQTTNIPIAVLYVYRQLWGIQHLRSMTEKGEFGRICAIEGKLWQASKVRHLSSNNDNQRKREWVNDKHLTGEYGVSLELGTHWLDTAQFLAGEKLELLACHKDRLHDDSSNDDYIHCQFRTSHGILVSGSITNMAHGARNDFEIAIIGERASAQWSLMEPDQILMGRGAERWVVYRHDMAIGSGQPAFHGVGWLEGYIEILRQSYRHLLGLNYQPYPTIIESNEVISIILNMMN